MSGDFTNKEKASKCGSKSKRGKSIKTKAWEQLGEYIINDGADRYLTLLNNMNNKEFLFEFKAIIEFFKPKQARIETRNEDENRLKVSSFNYKVINVN